LELRKKRQGQRIKAAALNEKPNGSIRGSRLLQQNLHFSDVPGRPDDVRSRGEDRKWFADGQTDAFDPGCVKTWPML